jgi:hypothetical protein
MTTYTVIGSRDQHAWDFRVSGLFTQPGDCLHSQASTLTEVAQKARNLIALVREVSEGFFDVDVEVKFELPAVVQEHLQHAAQLRDQAATAQAEALDEYRAAACELQSGGLTLRDIGFRATSRISARMSDHLQMNVNP